MPASFMITQVLSTFLKSEDFVSLYQTERRGGEEGQSKFSVTET
jgi:hypothetical protein